MTPASPAGRASSRLQPVPSQPVTPAPIASALLSGDASQAGDALATLTWGLRRYAWLVIACIAVVGVLLPYKQLSRQELYTSQALVVASNLTADLKVVPRYGEAIFDNGQVARRIIEQFGDGGDPEDVVPRRASVLSEQDNVVYRVEGHARDAQLSADIANVAAAEFAAQLNKAGSGIGTFIVQSEAIPPVERDEPLRAAPYAVGTGLVAGAVAGVGLLLLLLVLRRPVVDAAAASRATDLPVFGTVRLPRRPRDASVALEEVAGLAPLCRQLLDWSPEAVVLTGPDDIALERHHLARSLQEAIERVNQLALAGARSGEADDADPAGRGPVNIIDGASSIDLVAPGPRSFVLLVVPVGIAMSSLRHLSGELRGVPAAIVLVRSRGRRRRRSPARAGGGPSRGRTSEPARQPDRPSSAAPQPHRPDEARPVPAPRVPAATALDAGREVAPEAAATPAPDVPAPAEPAEPVAAAPAPAPDPVPDLEPQPEFDPEFDPQSDLELETEEPVRTSAASISPALDEDEPVTRHTGPPGDPSAVLAWAAAEAADWFPRTAGHGASLRLLDVRSRPRCRVHVIEVRGSGSAETFVVKQRLLGEGRRRDRFADTRPRLAPPMSEDTLGAALAEFEGLLTMHLALTERPGTGLASIEPLGLNEELAAVAMAYDGSPSLRAVTIDAEAGGNRPDVAAARPWAHAGTWLSRYHAVMPADGLPVLRGSVRDVVDHLQAFSAFLAPRVGHQSLLRRFADQASEAAEHFLGDQLAVATAHGDYVAQNILVHPDRSVAVIDPLPQWRAPGLEDVCRLLVGARLFEPETQRPDYRAARPRPRLRETALLTGYFGGGRVPVGPARVFLALCTLDRWADTVSKEPTGLLRRQARSSRVAAAGKHYVREIRTQLPLLLPSNSRWVDIWV